MSSTDVSKFSVRAPKNLPKLTHEYVDGWQTLLTFPILTKQLPGRRMERSFWQAVSYEDYIP